MIIWEEKLWWNVVEPGTLKFKAFKASRLPNSERVQLSPRKHKNWNTAMALPLQPGLAPTEVAFLCEMEMVTVIPRQRLESLSLLGVSI